METKFTPVANSRRLIPLNRDEQCGIGSWTPRCLQKFADPKVYLLIFCMLGIIQGAYFTYFIGVITTLEKRFAFESKVSGIIMIADNLSPIFTSLLIGYFGGRVHKPRLIAGGMLIVILSCFLSALPYFLFGPGKHLLSMSQITSKPKLEFCEEGTREENCMERENLHTVPAVTILFFANFLNGFGHTAFYTVGTPYLDDNVKKKNSPIYFSAMGALRIFGPALGFLLASCCLKYYEDPFYDPGINVYNPRWVGAWWMGFLIIGMALLIFTVLLALFPRELPERFRSEVKEKKEGNSEDNGIPRLRDFPQALKRLTRNPILVCHMISITFQINGFAGYFVFMPKFMEAQYQQSASDASLFSGATGIVAILLGIILGGIAIKKYKPRPRYLIGYMVFVEIFSVIGLLISIFLGCSSLEFPGTTIKEDETLNLYNECNYGCNCSVRVFEPVCGSDGTSTFFSPCFAGCPNTTDIMPHMAATATTLFHSTLMNSSFANMSSLSSYSLNTSLTSPVKMYSDCQCLSGINNTFISSHVTKGFCSTGCHMFLIYIIMLCISKFVSSTARVGNSLITLRCVDAKDKALAMGAFGSVLSMFAFIPYPLIFGALTDSACLVWERSCSKTGNCWLYDSDKFRFYLHGMAMLLISIGICFDGVVFLLSDRLSNFYGEEDEKNGHGEERIGKWLKEEEEEDILFLKLAIKKQELQMDPVS